MFGAARNHVSGDSEAKQYDVGLQNQNNKPKKLRVIAVR